MFTYYYLIFSVPSLQWEASLTGRIHCYVFINYEVPSHVSILVYMFLYHAYHRCSM